MTDRPNRLSRIFDGNRTWSERMNRVNPAYFEDLSKTQSPDYLWVGCSDSRVPANEIMDLLPGEVFVHRNIANVVVPSDLNFLSVLQYAIEILHIRHVIVCGHYGCGGIRAALEDEPHGLIDNWLNHIRSVRHHEADRFNGQMDGEAEADLLCELNVIQQVQNVCNTTILRDAWANGHDVHVHGLIYALRNGVLHELCMRSRPA